MLCLMEPWRLRTICGLQVFHPPLFPTGTEAKSAVFSHAWLRAASGGFLSLIPTLTNYYISPRIHGPNSSRLPFFLSFLTNTVLADY